MNQSIKVFLSTDLLLVVSTYYETGSNIFTAVTTGSCTVLFLIVVDIGPWWNNKVPSTRI